MGILWSKSPTPAQKIRDWIAAKDIHKQLNLSNLGLTEVPVGLPADLQNLNLDNNQIEVVPLLPGDILSLSIRNNRLKRVPPRLPLYLQNLYLDHNQIAEISEELPDSLAYLSLGYNKITELPRNLPPSLWRLNLHNQEPSLAYSLACIITFDPWPTESLCDYALRRYETAEAERAASRCMLFRDELCFVAAATRS